MATLKILHYPEQDCPGLARAMLPKAEESEILTLKQVADYFKVTERTIYRLAAAKKVPAFKVGGTWRFSRAAIAGWIKLQSTEGPATDRGDDNTSESQKTDAQGGHK